MKPLSLVIFLFAFAAEAKEAPNLLGHNLSQTSHVLDKGECTAGFLHGGCGVNDRLTVGFSPWLVLDYRMYSLAARYKDFENDKFARAFQFNYFKTFEDRDVNRTPVVQSYQMEALWTSLIYSRKYTPYFTSHYNVQLNYYFDEKMPFSLRRPYIDPNPLQFNLTSLLEINLYKNWFVQGELGALDILNSPIHFHGGASIGRKWSFGYFYFGYTFTPTLYSLFNTDRRDYQQELRYDDNGYDEDLDEDDVNYDYSIHPEITIQFFF